MNKTNSIFILIILLIAGCSSELSEESQRTINQGEMIGIESDNNCLLYTSPSPRDRQKSRMPSSA